MCIYLKHALYDGADCQGSVGMLHYWSECIDAGHLTKDAQNPGKTGEVHLTDSKLDTFDDMFGSRLDVFVNLWLMDAGQGIQGIQAVPQV